jgi:hypothetical protein
MTNPHDNIRVGSITLVYSICAAGGWHPAARLSETH